MVTLSDLIIYATCYTLGALSLYLYQQFFSNSNGNAPSPPPRPPAPLLPAQGVPATVPKVGTTSAVPTTTPPAPAPAPVVAAPPPPDATVVVATTKTEGPAAETKKRSNKKTSPKTNSAKSSRGGDVAKKDAARVTEVRSASSSSVPVGNNWQEHEDEERSPTTSMGSSADWSSPPTSPASYPLTSHEERELRALRADVENLKQTLALTQPPAISASPSTTTTTATTTRMILPADPALVLAGAPIRHALSDSIKLARPPTPTYGPMETYTSILPVLKKGWLDLRTFKMYNRRYFLLHGNWLTYFKDEKMRRGECYGHICLNSTCQVKELPSKERSFLLQNNSKTESLFRTRGPGINAATSHRMMHAASSKVVIRADLQELTTEWVLAVTSVITELAQPGTAMYYSVSETGSEGGESPQQQPRTNQGAVESASVGGERRTTRGFRRSRAPEAGRQTELVRMATTPLGERWKKQTNEMATNEVTSLSASAGSRTLSTPTGASSSTSSSSSSSSSSSAMPLPSQRRCRSDEEDEGLHRSPAAGLGDEDEDEEEDTATSSDEGVEEEEERPFDDHADSSTDSAPEELYVVEERYDYKWPAEQMAAVEELKLRLGETYRAEKCDEPMLWRFLKARQFDATLAHQMINEYLEWRRQYRPSEIPVEEIQDEITLGKAYFIGYDLLRRPIMVCHPGRHNPKTSPTDHFMRFVCFMIEAAIAHMRPPVIQFTAIIDMHDFGMSSLDSNMAKTAAHMLQSYYPERLGVLVAVNCGMVINVAWRMVKSLLDERTREKINFIKGVKDVPKIGIFDLDTLPLAYGGNSSRVVPPGSYGLEFLEE